MDTEAFAPLRQQILAARSAGVTHVLLEPIPLPLGGDYASVIDAVVTRLGFKPNRMQWREISSGEAASILRNILHRDLAYEAEIMPSEIAAGLADRFCALFPESTRYFTSCEWSSGAPGEPEKLAGWSPLTDATFDAGILAVGGSYIGVAWVEDED